MIEGQKDAPLTFGKFLEFYEKIIEPQLHEIPLIREDIIKMNDRFDFLFKKWEDLTQEYLVINAQLKRIDKKLETIEARVENPSQGLSEIKTRLSALESRNAEIRERLDKLQGTVENQNQEERESLAWDLKLLRNIVQKLESRIEKIESNGL